MYKCFIICLFLKLCTGSKETDEIDDENLPRILTEAGVKLVEELTSPRYKNGTDLMEDLFDYYNNLDDINELMDNDDPVRVDKGKELYGVMAERGGPPILKVKIDYGRLLQKYGWEEGGREVKYAEQVIKDISDLWRTMGIKSKHETTTSKYFDEYKSEHKTRENETDV